MADYSKNLEKIINRAQEFAKQLQHKAVSPNHLLLALIRCPETQAAGLLAKFKADTERVTEVLVHTRVNYEGKGDPTGALNSRAKGCLELAAKLARQMGSNLVRSEHLLLALLCDETMNANVFVPAQVDARTLVMNITEQYGCHAQLVGQEEAASNPEFVEVCTNLNELARLGKLDPVIGRKAEIQRAIQILGRRRKNNPVLLGEAGVGKTAIVEGIAQSIVKRTCPPALFDKVIYAFDLAGLVSNTVFRGQLEGRLKAVLQHVKDNPNIILFIDEIHMLVGAGNSVGGMDVSNMLKGALARGEAQAIGATTTDEYNKTVARDPALERRFQPVQVLEPSDEDTLAILRGSLPGLESHHDLKFAPEAAEAALQLSKRYVNNRQLPDKALDVLDEAASALKLATPDEILEQFPNPKLKQLEAEIAEAEAQRAAAAAAEDFAKAQTFPPVLERLRQRKKSTIAQILLHRVVGEDHVRSAVSRITGIPLERLTSAKKKEALQLSDRIANRIIGQRPAIETITRYVRRGTSKINDPNRPVGNVLLLGPTGVGKTLLAKTLATEHFGSEEALIQLDMSEFLEPHSVSRLIGSPPGYVGYKDQKTLVERVRRNPYAVVLFDEIEKAHQDVWNVLLQILEEGKLTDGEGREADFRNTIILLTSNVGFDQYHKGSIGFNSQDPGHREQVLSAVKKVFRPEFLNRLDDVVVFEALSREDCQRIIELEIEKVRERTQYSSIQLFGGLQEKLLAEGFSEEFGARNLKRTVERLVTDPVSDAILSDSIGNKGDIGITLSGGKVIVAELPRCEIRIEKKRSGTPHSIISTAQAAV